MIITNADIVRINIARITTIICPNTSELALDKSTTIGRYKKSIRNNIKVPITPNTFSNRFSSENSFCSIA